MGVLTFKLYLHNRTVTPERIDINFKAKSAIRQGIAGFFNSLPCTVCVFKKQAVLRCRNTAFKLNTLYIGNYAFYGVEALATKVGDIVSVEVGLNFSSADYDIIFIVAFADPFQLKQFQTNPEYLKIFQQAQGNVNYSTNSNPQLINPPSKL